MEVARWVAGQVVTARRAAALTVAVAATSEEATVAAALVASAAESARGEEAAQALRTAVQQNSGDAVEERTLGRKHRRESYKVPTEADLSDMFDTFFLPPCASLARR